MEDEQETSLPIRDHRHPLEDRTMCWKSAPPSYWVEKETARILDRSISAEAVVLSCQPEERNRRSSRIWREKFDEDRRGNSPGADSSTSDRRTMSIRPVAFWNRNTLRLTVQCEEAIDIQNEENEGYDVFWFQRSIWMQQKIPKWKKESNRLFTR